MRERGSNWISARVEPRTDDDAPLPCPWTRSHLRTQRYAQDRARKRCGARHEQERCKIHRLISCASWLQPECERIFAGTFHQCEATRNILSGGSSSVNGLLSQHELLGSGEIGRASCREIV